MQAHCTHRERLTALAGEYPVKDPNIQRPGKRCREDWRDGALLFAANWAANLFVAVTFLTPIHTVGRSVTFWLFGLVGVGAWLFSFYPVPETKGHSLEQIETDWHFVRHPRLTGEEDDHPGVQETELPCGSLFLWAPLRDQRAAGNA